MKKSVFIFLVTSAIFAITGCSQSSSSGSGSGGDSSDGSPTIKTYTTANGLKSNSIKTVLVKNNTVYVGTDGGLSVTADGGSTWKTYTTADGLAGDSVSSVYVGWEYMLVGTDKGLSESADDGKTWNTKTTRGVGSFIIDGDLTRLTSDGYLWSTSDYSTWSKYRARGGDLVTGVIKVGNTLYVSHFGCFVTSSADGGATWTTSNSGLGSPFVNALAASGSTVYAATLGGLSVSTDSGASWTTYTTANGLANDNVGCVAASDSDIYIGVSKSGMFASSDGGKSWKQYTTLDGLPSDSVNCVTVSGKKVYVGTDKGLAILQ